MIDHAWSVLCEHAIIDAETNNATLYNTIEEVTVLQALQPGARVGLSFEVVSLWVRSDPQIPAVGHVRLIVVGPSGETKTAGEVVIDAASAERSRTKFIFGSFSPVASGRYIFCVDYRLEHENDWHSATRIPLTVHLPSAGATEPVSDSERASDGFLVA